MATGVVGGFFFRFQEIDATVSWLKKKKTAISFKQKLGVATVNTTRKVVSLSRRLAALTHQTVETSCRSWYRYQNPTPVVITH